MVCIYVYRVVFVSYCPCYGKFNSRWDGRGWDFGSSVNVGMKYPCQGMGNPEVPDQVYPGRRQCLIVNREDLN